MKLILVHGNFQPGVLKKVAEIKTGFDPLSITESFEADLGLNFSSPSLFSDKRLVILENPDMKILEESLSQANPGLTVLVKFSKALEKSSAILKRVIEAKGEVFIFEESSQTSIFPFLDMLGNLNKKAYMELEKNYTEFGGQYILSMLAYFLRRMVQKPKTESGFIRQKIEAQKKNFRAERIIKLYRDLIETDFKIKQGLIEEKIGITLLVQKIIS
ncbi:hypothetical protein HYW44_05475 [Candidatus Daviesbacteria bacterium]|nr:hypothetical protein [Candidatus Daviesbacteria bacterium]